MNISLPFDQLKYLENIAAELNQVGHGSQGPIIERACEFLSVSQSTLYKRLTKVGWSSQRKLRDDLGQSKLTREQVLAVSNLILQSQRNTGKSLMSVEEAIEIAFANKLLDGRCSKTTMLRKMEEFGCHPKQLGQGAVTRSMRSLHPNHVWQFDVSVCVLYYLRGHDGLRVMEESEFYKNKPANLEKIKNERVLRYLVTDHYSGAFHLGYVMSPGESVEAITQFLIDAFSKRSDNELVHGVPYILIWDAGSANMAAMTKRLLDKLQVEHIAHTPGKPWAKGQVESMHNVIEKKFESRLAFTRITTIEELNGMATAWSVSFQSQAIHSRHGKTRYGLYQTIRKEQLRIAPDIEVMKNFVQSDRVERTVKSNDLSITFVPAKKYGSLSYKLDHLGVAAGQKVLVSANLYRCPAIDVEIVDSHGELITYLVEPVKRDEAGFDIHAPVYGAEHKAMALTTPQKNKKEMDHAAWGTSDPLAIKQKRKNTADSVAFGGAVDPMADVHQRKLPSFMKRSGTPLQVEGVREPQEYLSEIKAWKILSEETGLKGNSLTPIKQALKQAFPEGVTRKNIEEFLANNGGANAFTQTASV